MWSTQRDYKPNYHTIPSHGRWQHFEAGGRPRVDLLLGTWPSSVDSQERTRRLIDLFLVSVLLDAGAGTKWAYKSKESGKIYRRSEGLAIASLEMFKAGYFSSNSLEPCQVDSAGLKRLSAEQLGRGLQVTESNPILGLEGRVGLMSRLGDALQNAALFGADGRPGKMLGRLVVRLLFDQTKFVGRLSPIPPIHPSLVRSHHHHSDPLDGSDQWTGHRLAIDPNSDQRGFLGRCLAMFVHAIVPTEPTVGKHRSVPQTDSMALLFFNDAHDKTPQHPVCRHRTLDGPTGVSKRRTVGGYGLVDVERGGRQ